MLSSVVRILPVVRTLPAPGLLLGGLVSGLGYWKNRAGGQREKTERGKCHWLMISPCQAWGGAEFLEGRQSSSNADGKLNLKMQKMSSAIPEMKQGLISVGICCNQMKYGTVSVEKGTCGAAPAPGRGQMEETGVSWLTQLHGVCWAPGQDVCLEGKVLWEQPVLHIPWPCRSRGPTGTAPELGCCRKGHGGAAWGALWEGAGGFHVQLCHVP